MNTRRFRHNETPPHARVRLPLLSPPPRIWLKANFPDIGVTFSRPTNYYCVGSKVPDTQRGTRRVATGAEPHRVTPSVRWEAGTRGALGAFETGLDVEVGGDT